MDNTRVMIAMPEEFLQNIAQKGITQKKSNDMDTYISCTKIIIALARINGINETHILWGGNQLETNENFLQNVMQQNYIFPNSDQLAFLLFQAKVEPKIIKNLDLYKKLVDNYEKSQIQQQLPVYHPTIVTNNIKDNEKAKRKILVAKRKLPEAKKIKWDLSI